jgi:hypothetical protein
MLLEDFHSSVHQEREQEWKYTSMHRGKWLASCSGHINPRGRAPTTQQSSEAVYKKERSPTLP